MATVQPITLTQKEQKTIWQALDMLSRSTERQVKQRAADDPIAMAHAEYARDIQALIVKLRQHDLFR